MNGIHAFLCIALFLAALWLVLPIWWDMLGGPRECGERLAGFPDSVCRKPRRHPGRHLFELERSPRELRP